jgi:flagella basal body P-ring formation protein FlgA
MNDSTTNLIRLLLSRLERVSADSYWAHRASGIRGALLKTQQAIEEGRVLNPGQVEIQMRAGFDILERAGQERIRRSGPG